VVSCISLRVNQPVSTINSAPDFWFKGLSDDWPLIRYLIDDEHYLSIFNAEVRKFIENVFYPDKVIKTIMENMDLVEPSVLGVEGEKPPYTMLRSTQDFVQERIRISDFVKQRYQTALDYLKMKELVFVSKYTLKP